MIRILMALLSMIFFCSLVSAASVYDFRVKSIDGKEVDLGQYKNKVVLIVNTASQCGFTPQLKKLQELQAKYKDKGFTVIAFPSNDFKQNPEESLGTQKFMEEKYEVKFPIMDKIKVSGKDKHPLYKLMIEQKPRVLNEVQWNFEKFLVNKQGQVVDRWISTTDPLDSSVTTAIEEALK